MIDVTELWEEASEAARELADKSEFWRRAAIGRLYYAVYHAAGHVVGVHPAGGASNHERLLGAMKASRDVQVTRAAARYDSLKIARVKADYLLGVHVTRHDVLTALNHATSVRALLGLTPSSP